MAMAGHLGVTAEPSSAFLNLYPEAQPRPNCSMTVAIDSDLQVGPSNRTFKYCNWFGADERQRWIIVGLIVNGCEESMGMVVLICLVLTVSSSCGQ
jgi:hypothetical protein